MTYKEYKDARQEEANNLPIFFAFNKRQLKEELEKRGIKLEEAEKYTYRLGHTSGFYLKKDSSTILDFFKDDRSAKLRKMMEEDLDFAREAIEYEMYNHEYPINWEGDYNVASCFGRVEYTRSIRNVLRGQKQVKTVQSIFIIFHSR